MLHSSASIAQRNRKKDCELSRDRCGGSKLEFLDWGIGHKKTEYHSAWIDEWSPSDLSIKDEVAALTHPVTAAASGRYDRGEFAVQFQRLVDVW